MTAQIPDYVEHQNIQYTLTGVKGKGLFQPGDYGLSPRGFSTNNYRGYHLTYTVREGRLWVTELHVSGSQANPALDGISPLLDDRGEAVYCCLKLPVLFTGKLYISSDFTQYIHMGFAKPFQFENTLELVFDQGNLETSFDYSEQVEDMRRNMQANPAASSGDMDELARWIEKRFSLDVDLDNTDED